MGEFLVHVTVSHKQHIFSAIDNNIVSFTLSRLNNSGRCSTKVLSCPVIRR